MILSRGLLPIFVLAVAVCIQQSSETESSNPPNKTNKYCGRNLVNVLTMVCDGVYNHHMPGKDGKPLVQYSKVRVPMYFYREIISKLTNASELYKTFKNRNKT